MIEELLQNKNAKEKSLIKSREIAKVFKNASSSELAKFTDETYGVEVEILSLASFSKNNCHGVEVLAKAWKDGQPLGFSKDGSVEVERFRFYNPPIMVDDPNGTVERVRSNGSIRKLREDPIAAIKESLAHTIKNTGKISGVIVSGKVGNTVSTFYPDPNVESTSVDGMVEQDSTAADFTAIRNAAGTLSRDNSADDTAARLESSNINADGFRWRAIRRGIYLFDTSAIDDADSIDSATLSLSGFAKSDALSATPDINIYSSAPASNTALAAGDYDSLGTTAFSTTITYASFDATNYNDFALNASGLAAITKTGVSKFGSRNANYDVADVDPPYVAVSNSSLDVDTADTSGTTSDPKLVVTHTAASGPANLKTWNGLAKASVKTINGLAIASVKTVNGLT